MIVPADQLAKIRAELDSRAFVAARGLCDSALQQYGADATLFALAGYACQQAGEHEDAISYCRDAITANGELWLAFLTSGRSLQALGRLSEAYDALAEARRLASEDANTVLQHIEVVRAVDGLESALASFAAAPTALQDAVSREQLEAALKRGLATASRPHATAVRERLDSGDPLGAEALIREVLGALSDSGELHGLLAYSLHQQKRYEEALASSAVATALDASDWLAFLVCGQSSQALGRLAEARDALAEARRLAPEDANTALQHVEVVRAVDGLRAAFASFASAPASLQRVVSREQLEAALKRGLVTVSRPHVAAVRERLDSGDPVGAEALIRKALGTFSDSEELHGLLAYSLYQQTRYEEALVSSVAATAFNPSDWLALLVRGQSFRALGRLDEARATFAKAVEAHPADAGFRNHLLETTAAARGYHAAGVVMSDAPLGSAETPAERLWHMMRIEHGDLDPVSDDHTIVAKLETGAAWAARHNLPVHDLGSAEIVPIVDPWIWGRPEPSRRVDIKGSRPYVTEIRDATIVSHSSIVQTNDDSLLNDVGADERYGAFALWSYDKSVAAQSGRSVMALKPCDGATEIDGGIMLSGLASDAFGHWVPEYLARIPWLEQHPSYREFPVIVDAGMPTQHLDYLRLVCDRPLLTLPAGAAFHCRRLIYAPPRGFFPVDLVAGHRVPSEEAGSLSVDALELLRDRVLARLPSRAPFDRGRPRRLFLGRRGLSWRRLTNEAEITAALERLGFETVCPQDLTFAEQVDLFRYAEAIVAPNGSSLLNLIFAPLGTPTIVLSQGAVFNWGGFQGPMEALGYRTLFVCSSTDMTVNKHSDYTIAASTVLEALASVGIV